MTDDGVIGMDMIPGAQDKGGNNKADLIYWLDRQALPPTRSKRRRYRLGG
jgi:hypothetical protein